MTEARRVHVRVSRHLDAAPERAFDAWLDPARAGRFLFATPTGAMVRAEVDARVGGRFTFTDRRDGVDVEHVGEYLELDRPRRLVFRFAVPQYSDEWTRVAIDIVPDGAGCTLTLTLDGVPETQAERAVDGWRGILAGLDATLR